LQPCSDGNANAPLKKAESRANHYNPTKNKYFITDFLL